MGNIKVGRMIIGGFQTNCYFIYREGVKDSEGRCPVLIVDPAEKGIQIHQVLAKRGFWTAGILLTHGHADHIGGVKELAEAAEAEIYAYEGEKNLLQDVDLNLSARFGMPITLEADHYFKDGEETELAGMKFRVISTAGHTEGSCCYYFEEGGFLISGDTLFVGSVGRTDFPTGSMSLLVRNIKNKLFVLPDSTIVYPGHGGSTTIGYEKENNPFVV